MSGYYQHKDTRDKVPATTAQVTGCVVVIIATLASCLGALWIIANAFTGD